MRICLDTSAYSYLRRGYDEVANLVYRANWIGVPVTVIGELETGFRYGTRYESNVQHLDDFLRHPWVHIIDVDQEIAEIYGEFHANVLQEGNPIPTNDLWIAAATARVGATLVTFDKQFERIPRIGKIVLEN